MIRGCPKCGRDYSTDPYWTTSLKRHLARKIPCTLKPIIAPTLRCLDSVIISEPIVPPVGLVQTPELVAPWFFNQVFRDKLNISFVMSCTRKDEVVVKVSQDEPARTVTLHEFLVLFVNHVLIKHFPRECEVYGAISCFLYTENDIDLDDNTATWDGWDDGKSRFLNALRPSVLKFLDIQPSRLSFKNYLKTL
jgi:hypothetical protein